MINSNSAWFSQQLQVTYFFVLNETKWKKAQKHNFNRLSAINHNQLWGLKSNKTLCKKNVIVVITFIFFNLKNVLRKVHDMYVNIFCCMYVYEHMYKNGLRNDENTHIRTHERVPCEHTSSYENLIIEYSIISYGIRPHHTAKSVCRTWQQKHQWTKRMFTGSIACLCKCVMKKPTHKSPSLIVVPALFSYALTCLVR